MSGMGMLLRSMGFDPEAVTKQVQEFMGMMQQHNERMDRMEKQQDEIIRLLNERKK